MRRVSLQKRCRRQNVVSLSDVIYYANANVAIIDVIISLSRKATLMLTIEGDFKSSRFIVVSIDLPRFYQRARILPRQPCALRVAARRGLFKQRWQSVHVVRDPEKFGTFATGLATSRPFDSRQ